MPYLWAAYRMGVWNYLLEEDLDRNQFTDFVSNFSQISELFILFSDKPLGLISLREDTKIIEPHIDWFPWVSDRNKIEGLVKAVLELREIKPLLIWSKEETKDFFVHVAKYGIIRRVGTFHSDEKYSIFQSKEA